MTFDKLPIRTRILCLRLQIKFIFQTWRMRRKLERIFPDELVASWERVER